MCGCVPLTGPAGHGGDVFMWWVTRDRVHCPGLGWGHFLSSGVSQDLVVLGLKRWPLNFSFSISSPLLPPFLSLSGR